MHRVTIGIVSAAHAPQPRPCRCAPARPSGSAPPARARSATDVGTLAAPTARTYPHIHRHMRPLSSPDSELQPRRLPGVQHGYRSPRRPQGSPRHRTMSAAIVTIRAGRFPLGIVEADQFVRYRHSAICRPIGLRVSLSYSPVAALANAQGWRAPSPLGRLSDPVSASRAALHAVGSTRTPPGGLPVTGPEISASQPPPDHRPNAPMLSVAGPRGTHQPHRPGPTHPGGECARRSLSPPACRASARLPLAPPTARLTAARHHERCHGAVPRRQVPARHRRGRPVRQLPPFGHLSADRPPSEPLVLARCRPCQRSGVARPPPGAAYPSRLGQPRNSACARNPRTRIDRR